MSMAFSTVIPAKAGTQSEQVTCPLPRALLPLCWIPAFAGMTMKVKGW